MNNYEEELQKNIEAGKFNQAEEADIKAYQYLFKSLKKEPEFQLPPSFTNKVVNALMEKQSVRSATSEYVWMGIGFFLLLISCIVAIVLTEFKLDFGFLKALSGYKGIFIFGTVFIILLQWLDKRLVRDKHRKEMIFK